jgi:hypothetical protein
MRKSRSHPLKKEKCLCLLTPTFIHSMRLCHQWAINNLLLLLAWSSQTKLFLCPLPPRPPPPVLIYSLSLNFISHYLYSITLGFQFALKFLHRQRWHKNIPHQILTLFFYLLENSEPILNIFYMVVSNIRKLSVNIDEYSRLKASIVLLSKLS